MHAGDTVVLRLESEHSLPQARCLGLLCGFRLAQGLRGGEVEEREGQIG